MAFLPDNLGAESAPLLLLGALRLMPWPKHALLLCRLWRSERWLPSLGSMLGGTLRLPRTTVADKMSLSRWGAAARQCCCLPGYCPQTCLNTSRLLSLLCKSPYHSSAACQIRLELPYLHTFVPGRHA